MVCVMLNVHIEPTPLIWEPESRCGPVGPVPRSPGSPEGTHLSVQVHIPMGHTASRGLPRLPGTGWSLFCLVSAKRFPLPAPLGRNGFQRLC